MCGKPTALLSNLRGDVGIAPYANGKILPFIGAWPLPEGLPALSCLERVPPQRRVWRGHLQLKNGPGSCGKLAPLIRPGYALPPTPWGKASTGGG